MRTEKDIIGLAENKLKAAELLLENGFTDDAYYIGGYCFELLLKARICRTLGIPNFFDFGYNNIKSGIQTSFKSHDYEELIILSGIWRDFEKEIGEDRNIAKAWSIAKPWDERFRYKTAVKKEDAISFIEAQKILKSWIIKYL